MNKSNFNTALLFLVFNRPSLTKDVFEIIKKVKPKKLYVACDGARNEKEISLVNEVRKIVCDISWTCKLKTLFRNKNLGCKIAVASAIDWFFEHEKMGIILEDDCLPNIDFFFFCEELLNKYENNSKISIINGTNFQNGIVRGTASYYFTNYPHIWGWATWKRFWKGYDRDISYWPKWKNSTDLKTKFPNFLERKFWSEHFDLVHEKKIDTWDYQVFAYARKINSLAIAPNVNLVSNLGFGMDATHTSNSNSKYANMKFFDIGKLYHPNKIEQNIKADKYEFKMLHGYYKIVLINRYILTLKTFVIFFLKKIKLFNLTKFIFKKIKFK